MKTLFSICLIISLLLVNSVFAAEWSVMPINLHLSAQAKSQTLTVSNSGKKTLRAQAKTVVWTQKDGIDVQEETKDLVFYPKIIVVPPGQDRIIRLGLAHPQIPTVEKAYRIILEEIPEPVVDEPTKSTSAKVNIITVMSVPIFLLPKDGKPSLEVVSNKIGTGLDVSVKNTGNVHANLRRIVINGVDASDKQVCSVVQQAWYLLPGISRNYQIKLPSDCAKATSFGVEVIQDNAKTLSQVTTNVSAQ